MQLGHPRLIRVIKVLWVLNSFTQTLFTLTDPGRVLKKVITNIQDEFKRLCRACQSNSMP